MPMVPKLTPLEDDTTVKDRHPLPGRCESCGGRVEMREVAPFNWVWCDLDGVSHECRHVSIPGPA
jgi:hypothetical protein